MQAWRAAGKTIPGYGHPLHKERDPRVGALFEVARAGRRRPALRRHRRGGRGADAEVLGKDLKLNVSGAIPAVLLGVGLPGRRR